MRSNLRCLKALDPAGYQSSSALIRWRRGWDSNPRELALCRFSRPVPSTTRPPLQFVANRSFSLPVNIVEFFLQISISLFFLLQNFIALLLQLLAIIANRARRL